MLRTTGLGVVWRTKEKFQREVSHRLNGDRLDELLALMGPWGDAEKGEGKNKGGKYIVEKGEDAKEADR